jgi:hypothetical protein
MPFIQENWRVAIDLIRHFFDPQRKRGELLADFSGH